MRLAVALLLLAAPGDADYSPSMREAGRARGLVWSARTLDAFLADPAGYTSPGRR